MCWFGVGADVCRSVLLGNPEVVADHCSGVVLV